MKPAKGFCDECGELDCLDENRICPNCLAERELDLEQHYAEQEET